MTWKNGRQLSTLHNGENSINYNYDSKGVRASKTVNGIKYTYVYENGLLMYETRGNAKYYYSYDANGTLYSVKYTLTDTSDLLTYYYSHNSRGDIVGIYNGNGELRAKYEYDAWGNVLSIKDASGNTITSATHIGNLNPFRYRGYYYDSESGFYYVSSRYYDPEIGRWLNADSLLSQGSVLGNNMFAYCLNNPVNMADTTGELPFFLVTAAIGAVAGAIIGGVVAAKNGGNVWAGIGIGAAAGGLAGAGLGAAAGVVLAGSATASTAAVVSGAGMVATAVSTGGAGGGLALVADNISRSVNNVGTVLYSGGEQARQAATTFANNTGGTTIDPTVIGQVADAATKVPGADFTTVWSQASAAFCHQASGVVNAFVSNSAYRGVDSIFWSVEMPTLLNNPRVTEIIIHFFE